MYNVRARASDFPQGGAAINRPAVILLGCGLAVALVARAAHATPHASYDVISQTAQQIEDLVNLERARHGLGPLLTSSLLRQSAARHSIDMARGLFCHQGDAGGGTPASRMRDAGYGYPYGELVSCGQGSAARTVRGWMSSPGHRSLVLCAACTEMGAGYESSPSGYRHYWTIDLGTRPVAGIPTPTPAGPGPAPTTAPGAPPSGGPWRIRLVAFADTVGRGGYACPGCDTRLEAADRAATGACPLERLRLRISAPGRPDQVFWDGELVPADDATYGVSALVALNVPPPYDLALLGAPACYTLCPNSPRSRPLTQRDFDRAANAHPGTGRYNQQRWFFWQCRP